MEEVMFWAIHRSNILRMYNDTPRTLQGWIDLLAVSTRFGFPRIRDRAIAEISSVDDMIDPVEKVVLAKTHNVPQWLAPAYETLCQREKALEVGEARRLEVDTTALIAQAREAVRALGEPYQTQPITPISRKKYLSKPKLAESLSSSHLRPSVPYNPSDVSRIVREVFCFEIP
jgi:hypothetical protein